MDCDKRNVHELRMYPTVKKKELLLECLYFWFLLKTNMEKSHLTGEAIKWTCIFSTDTGDSKFCSLKCLPIFSFNQREWGTFLFV